MILSKLKSALCVGSPGTRKAAKLFYFLWLIAYEKQRVLIFPQDSYQQTPLFSLGLICVYAKMDFCLLHTMHTHIGLVRTTAKSWIHINQPMKHLTSKSYFRSHFLYRFSK